MPPIALKERVSSVSMMSMPLLLKSSTPLADPSVWRNSSSEAVDGEGTTECLMYDRHKERRHDDEFRSYLIIPHRRLIFSLTSLKHIIDLDLICLETLALVK